MSAIATMPSTTATQQPGTATPTEATISVATSSFVFYDIESLANVFSLCAYTPAQHGREGVVEIFHLVDDDALRAQFDPAMCVQVVDAANPGGNAGAKVYDLHTKEANERLAILMGLSDAKQVCNPKAVTSFSPKFRPTCDTDGDYKPDQHPFLAGYNSHNYDTVMLASYLDHAFPTPHREENFMAPAAATMRKINDQLFTDEFRDFMPRFLGWDTRAARIRRAMLDSGRHLDVARLNELQVRVGLKRLLGMLGHQIKESDKLSHDTSITDIDQLYELLAYNVSDCLGLAHLFVHPTYSNAFDLKAGLLTQYQETRYDSNGGVRFDRLGIDTSSAKFVGRILAPHGPLQDIESVSFNYPHPEVAKERGTTPVNVLTQCREFFYEQVADPDARARFDTVYEYYRSIEGKNFNDSQEYTEVFSLPAHSLREIPKAANNLPYFYADGSSSSCFATFSTGGIHGAELNRNRFIHDQVQFMLQVNMLERVRQAFPDACDYVAAAKDQHNQLTLPDGSHVDKRLVLYGSDPAKVKYRNPKKGDDQQNEQLARAKALQSDPVALLSTQRDEGAALDLMLADGHLVVGKAVLANTSLVKASYRDQPQRKNPVLFVPKADGSNKLHPRYTRTSAAQVIHEDFTSYYPNLLRNMRAFYNPDLGEDRYAKIFFDKERYGQLKKQPGIDPGEKERLDLLRNGTKLILNSASGAGDAAHKNPIRMNNQIISMRIIGQLFSWRIGQAQTLAGAKIISTNTDGLYSVVDGGEGFDIEVNNRVLQEQSEAIGVEIEPELMYLISKDSNNRMELEVPSESESDSAIADARITTASGSTLACHGGPTPTKALAHPALIDRVLARYLQTMASQGQEAFERPFDPDLGRQLVEAEIDHSNPVRTLMLFQNVIAAARGSITYPFAADPVVDTSITDEAGEEGAATPPQDGVTASDSPTHDKSVEPLNNAKNEEDGNQLVNPRPLQMINRVFVVRGGTPGAVSLHNAGAWKVTAESKALREANGLRSTRDDPVAIDILSSHGLVRGLPAPARNANGEVIEARSGLVQLPIDQDVAVRKINGIDPDWSMLVLNDSLHLSNPDALRAVIKQLDLDVYVQMLDHTYSNNWRNVPLGQ